jgi:competence protein ComEC
VRPPPLSVVLALAYGAGLATGLSRFRAPGCVVLALLALLLRDRRATWLALAAALGVLAAATARWHAEGSCASQLPTVPFAVGLRLEEPVGPDGGMARAVPHELHCTGAVLARWPRHRPLAAGSLVHVEGTWLPDSSRWRPPSGLLVVARVRALGQVPTLSDATRGAAARTSAALYGPRAPLVDALVIGRRSAMDRDLRDAFAASGLVHLLSISGFHVGLLAAWVVLVARAFRARRGTALALGAVLATAYVAFLGWQAPAVRAVALLWVLALLRIRQRAVEADALLAVTVLVVLLADPWAVTDLGAWLSVLSLWGAVRFARWAAARGGTAWGWQALASSVGATMATAPLTAATLGAVAPIGIVLNFAAIPIAAVAVPGVIASLLAAPLSMGLAGALAAGSGLGLDALEALARLGAAIPHGHVLVPAGLGAAWPWLLAVAALCWATPRHHGVGLAGERLAWTSAATLWIVLLWPAIRGVAGREPGLTLHFLDVGQGDAAVIVTPGGHAVVVDAGPRNERFDAGRRVVLPFLERHGVRRVEALVVSHGHADHVGGATALLARLPVSVAVEPEAPVAEAAYLELLEGLAASGTRWVAGRPGLAFELDSVRFRVLHPDTSWAGWATDVNDDSVVLLVEYGAFRALFAGDAGVATERALHSRIGPVALLKVGHHGSRTSTGEPWLAELSPRLAIVSVGTNTYGHPAPEVLDRLGAHHASVWRTDREGTISVVTDGRQVRVSGRQRRMTLELPAVPADHRDLSPR